MVVAGRIGLGGSVDGSKASNPAPRSGAPQRRGNQADAEVRKALEKKPAGP